jgi:phage shock protein C
MADEAVRCAACGRAVPAIAIEKKMIRPRYDRKIAGVCAAFANYFNLDVTLVRLVWVIVTLFTGLPLLAYLLAWIVIPEEPETVIVMRPQA